MRLITPRIFWSKITVLGDGTTSPTSGHQSFCFYKIYSEVGSTEVWIRSHYIVC